MFEDYRMEAMYRDLRELMRAGAPVAPIPPDTLKFPTLVYEKCADRIGMLGPTEAAAVVRFYGILIGVQTGVRVALSDLPMAGRIAALDHMLDRMLPSELPRVEQLLVKLQAVVDQSWLASLSVRPEGSRVI
jgi:hypothetical protein